MAKDIDTLVSEAAAVLSDALDEAAAIALVAVERYGAKLQTFCKQVADEAGIPDAWNSLRHRAQDMEKARSAGLASRRTAGTRARTVRAAKQALRDPEVASALPHTDKVELARSLMSDPEVAQAALSEPATWSTVMRSASQVEPASSRAEPASRAQRRNTAEELNREWREWLNQLNTLLMRGAALAERTEQEDVALDASGASGHLIYQRITERKLDAEIREFFEAGQRGEAR
jgi:hypothetical protein